MNKKLSLLRDRKAVSQVVSSLLILAIVTTLCVTVYGWAVSTVGDSQDNFNFIYEHRKNAIKERFTLEYVFFTDTDGNPGDHKNVTIYVRNVGNTDLTISDVDLNGTLSPTVNPTLPQTLPSNQVIKLSVTLATSWNSNSTTHIAVTSERGNLIQGYWEAP